MFKFNYTFITEVKLKGGVVQDYIILRAVSNFLSSLFTYEGGRILETPPPLSMTSMLKHIIELTAHIIIIKADVIAEQLY